MKTKVAIVTITGNNNYGNRLQNYALQYTLEKLGCDVKTIRNFGDGKMLMRLKTSFRFLYSFLVKMKNKRTKAFEEFDERYIHFSKKQYLSNSKKNKDAYFDYYIAGSDQIWNPYYCENAECNFLDFANYKKSISYAASFGANSIPEERRKEIKKYLLGIKDISVREDAGKDLVKELTKRNDVEVLIDPTMLLDNKEWSKLARRPKMYDGKKYILSYFLGCPSSDEREAIRKIAERNDCIVIDILNRNSLFYDTGPSEFLWLEKNAQLICTDSYHSSVFAMIFDRPFYVFERKKKEENNMGSRIDTLLNKFELEEHKYSQKNNNILEIKAPSYYEAKKILKKEQMKSIDFLKEALNMEK